MAQLGLKQRIMLNDTCLCPPRKKRTGATRRPVVENASGRCTKCRRKRRD